ncbi:MAG: transketolase C-terminal domain-containing protein, partial [Pseudomonadota bacterium]
YLTRDEIAEDEARDPLLYGAARLVAEKISTPETILNAYHDIEARLERIAGDVVTRPKLVTSASVMDSLVPPTRICQPSNGCDPDVRDGLFADERAALDQPQHMARLLSWALADLMLEHEAIILAGEDIGPKGGVYNVTAKLHQRFGPNRVINTLLDEQSILGLAIGLSQAGYLPIPEIQFLAYLHNAEDQLRGEAATLSFFSKGQFTNPMVVRIAGLAYQRGFGGHFHNDNSVAVLRDIPGLVLACPSHGRDAVQMLRECVRLAREEQRVVVFLEPIARYMTRDLYAEGDKLWTSIYEPPGVGTPVRFGEVGQVGEGTDLAIFTYGNGCFLSRQAEKILSEQYGVRLRVIDLRWLAPLPVEALLAAVEPCQNILIVDECRRTGSISEEIMACLVERRGADIRLRRITADDSFIPLGRGATVTLPDTDGIVAAARALLDEGRS